MMLRRYIGRAHGTRRRPKFTFWHRNKSPLYWALAISAAILGLVLIAVLIFNPGNVRPDGEKGSQPSPGVNATPTPTESEKSPGTA